MLGLHQSAESVFSAKNLLTVSPSSLACGGLTSSVGDAGQPRRTDDRGSYRGVGVPSASNVIKLTSYQHVIFIGILYRNVLYVLKLLDTLQGNLNILPRNPMCKVDISYRPTHV